MESSSVLRGSSSTYATAASDCCTNITLKPKEMLIYRRSLILLSENDSVHHQENSKINSNQGDAKCEWRGSNRKTFSKSCNDQKDIFAVKILSMFFSLSLQRCVCHTIVKILGEFHGRETVKMRKTSKKINFTWLWKSFFLRYVNSFHSFLHDFYLISKVMFFRTIHSGFLTSKAFRFTFFSVNNSISTAAQFSFSCKWFFFWLHEKKNTKSLFSRIQLFFWRARSLQRVVYIWITANNDRENIVKNIFTDFSMSASVTRKFFRVFSSVSRRKLCFFVSKSYHKVCSCKICRMTI